MAYQQNYIDKPIGRDELACVYSALILADDDIPITAEKIKTILAAAEIEVESIWPSLFARALQGVDIRELLRGSAGQVGGTVGTTAAPAGTAPAAEEEKKEEAKPVESEEDSDEDFGLSLFD